MKKQRPKSDSSGSIRGRKIDGTPLNKKEVAKAERLLRTYMESPPKALLEGPITLHHETLDRWLTNKFAAIYDLSVLYGMDVTDKPRERFIDVLRQISYVYMQAHLDRALSAAFYMVASIWHDQFLVNMAMMIGMPPDTYRHGLVTRKELKHFLDSVYQSFIDGLPQRDGRGGDRKSGAKLTEAELDAMDERKTILTPFWTILIRQIEAFDYEYDAWDTIKNRKAFQQKCADHSVTSLQILDTLIPEVSKRKPYWDKSISGRMPESLFPAAFALRHAALEIGVRETYEALKKKLAQNRKQKQEVGELTQKTKKIFLISRVIDHFPADQ